MAASRLFDSRYKLLVHIFEIVLIVAVLVLSLVKLLNLPKNAPRSRSNTMALGMVCSHYTHRNSQPSR